VTRVYGRRQVLRGAAVLTVAAPILWRESGSAAAATPAIGPRWIAYGASASTTMYVSWSTGTAGGTVQKAPKPQIKWGTTTAYGKAKIADSSAPAPVPANFTGEPAENTIYSQALLSGLTPSTTYHYAVSNDGVTWSADATFTTAFAGWAKFRFTAFGDQAAGASTAAPMTALVAAQKPAFHIMAGDLAYATPLGLKYPDVTGFSPGQWDKYLDVVGPGAAKSIPWQVSVGAHEVEPLGSHGYAGFVARFPQAYDLTSGSPVTHAYTHGNVAFIHLDGNDLSAQETINTGYTGGGQTAWLKRKLATYRAASSGIDFVVVVCNCCCYSTNQEHGSDGGLRDAWGPLFDTYTVDLVISGHVHAYERTNPIRAGQPTRKVASGGIVSATADGTTYICAGGGGNGLYKTWYGATGSGDAGSATAPKIWRWSGGDTASGGTGKSVQSTDTAKNFSAVRRAVFSALVVDVVPRGATNPTATMTVQALMPAQTATTVTSITSPTVIDKVTLTRTT
jgi:hypothetical protein